MGGPKSMPPIREILALSVAYLEKKGVESARRQAEQVIADALGISRLQMYADFDRPLVDQEVVTCREAVVRRGKGEPAAYIKGQVEFYGCSFALSRDVLIPRQETEILADLIVKKISGLDLSGKVFWDVCTGSGCLAVSIKKKLPNLSVVATDLSGAALSIAKKNALENGVDIEFLQGDLLSPLDGREADFVVCNPPYISQKDYQTLHREVHDFEPELALVGGDDGLAFYRRLASELPNKLRGGGRAWLEIGYDQGSAVKSLFAEGVWKALLLETDWSGHDRFFSLEKE